jgi:hypothetical protein
MKYIKLFEDFKDTSDLKEKLDSYGIENYTINSDGVIDVDGEVNLANKNLDEIPFNFGKVTDSFIIVNNNLTSLEGCPYYVGGEFACQFNKLKNLKGSPDEIVYNFYASKNNLESLEGMPSEIGGNFYCDGNPNLKELDSISNIEGEIHCDGNVDISKFRGYCKKIVNEKWRTFLSLHDQ